MNDATTCPVCFDSGAAVQRAKGWRIVKCVRCGEFRITDEAKLDWETIFQKLSAKDKSNAAAWVRNHQGIALTTDDLSALRDVSVPTVADRAAILLEELGRRTAALGKSANLLGAGNDDPGLIAQTWSQNIGEVSYLAWNYLCQEKGFIVDVDGTYTRPMLSPKGYAYLEERSRTNQNSSIGFCAMWFDPELTPTWKNAIDPAIAGAGYEPKRIDRHEHNNKIDDEIIALIRRSRFVVADFTGQRGGVYFEAGYAQGLGLPVIWTVRADALKDIHFDTRQYNFVTWTTEHTSDFFERLKNRIEATIGRGPIVS